ncbi:OadG family transporter subunit [Marinomonas sp. 15G1-11]|uniref:Probable oxaloacetate decarboxylase gamma chain n=1 Tax=Marinomonas phaeophyticola TaxID=3004091 RepID=A0ABT4JUQ5_9GAMM|nr:OadG family transporter subunit [Marinomonas sp. 15G1-11]MCZ2722074.1 OadG family transporter subunit [Marinomonas sp. 15G1-11]
MNGLIQDGFGLLVLGMGFVFLFLVLLIYATGFMSTLLTKYFPEVAPVVKTSVAPAATKIASQVQDEHLKAVITAAIHQHRNNKR